MIQQPDLFSEIKPSYTLNTGQQAAIEWLIPFCMGHQQERKVLLEGWAGVGKSFLLNRMVEKVKEIDANVNFGMTAPTHKAVRVLKRSSELKDQLDFGTIHSFLGLKEKINEVTGKVTYEPEFLSGKPRRIESVDVLIVDESSMLSDELFEHIETEMRSNRNLLVIYTGDSLQIPPVGKKQKTGVAFAIPFIPERRTSHKLAHLVLTEPQRQAKESPIIAYATAIREQHNRQSIEFDIKPDHSNALEIVPQQLPAMQELFKTYFKTSQFNQDPDYVKVIAWRNDRVNYFNRIIRLIMNDAETLPKFIVGEKLIMDKPFASKDKILIPNNEEVEVVHVETSNISLSYKIIDKSVFAPTKGNAFDDPQTQSKIWNAKVYKLAVTTPDRKSFILTVLHEDSEQEYTLVTNELETAAKKCKDQFDRKEMWRQFYAIERSFAWVKYNYCVTAHKSQGSTYEYVISCEFDMNANKDIPERNSLKYVAATRARTKLFIVK